MMVQIGPNRLRLLGFQFISVRQNSLQFKSTAEVTAEVNPLRAVQGVTLNWRDSPEFTKTTEKLLKYGPKSSDILSVQGVNEHGVMIGLYVSMKLLLGTFGNEYPHVLRNFKDASAHFEDVGNFGAKCT